MATRTKRARRLRLLGEPQAAQIGRLPEEELYTPRAWIHEGFLYLAFHKVQGTRLELGISYYGDWLTVTLTFNELKPTDLHPDGAYLSAPLPEEKRSVHLRLPLGVRVAPYSSEWLVSLPSSNYAVARMRTVSIFIDPEVPDHVSEPKEWR